MPDPAPSIAPLATLLLVVSGVIWAVYLRRRREIQPWFLSANSPVVPWGLADIALAGFLLLLATTTSLQVFVTLGWITALPARIDVTQPEVIMASAIGTVSAWVLSLLWLRHRGASDQDLGIGVGNVWYEILAGVVTYLLITPPVLLLLVLLSGLTGWDEKHPLITALVEQGEPRLYWSIAVAAVVAAPLWEEFLFRVVILSWLERVFFLWYSDQRPWGELWGLALFGANSPASVRSLDRLRITPIVLTSLIFAAAHPHGLAPIPLFFLASTLGFVYQRSRSWLACTVTHMLFNATTMLQLWFYVK